MKVVSLHLRHVGYFRPSLRGGGGCTVSPFHAIYPLHCPFHPSQATLAREYYLCCNNLWGKEQSGNRVIRTLESIPGLLKSLKIPSKYSPMLPLSPTLFQTATVTLLDQHLSPLFLHKYSIYNSLTLSFLKHFKSGTVSLCIKNRCGHYLHNSPAFYL